MDSISPVSSEYIMIIQNSQNNPKSDSHQQEQTEYLPAEEGAFGVYINVSG